MKFSEEQEKIFEDTSKFQQVVASAGSGKTTTMIGLLGRILERKQENPEEILVLTFTRKAREEFETRLQKKHPNHKVKIYTFHAYALSVLQRFHPKFQEKPAQILDEVERDRIWKSLLKEYKFQIGGIPYEFFTNQSSRKIQNLFPNLFFKLNSQYEDYKRANNYLDFDDIIQIYLNGLEREEFWAVRARRELTRIIIDEYQDTDPTQLKWVQLMQPERLTVVGDDWQAIYGFRGATVEPFLKFRDYFPNAKIHYLTTNYRSLKEIVKISAIPISHNKKNIPKQVRAFRTGKGLVRKILIENEEWDYVLKYIQTHSNEEIKILCRTNYRILRLSQLGIPQENLMTIHSAKGLEFDTVFLDLTDGWSNEEEIDLEEERRILYVGLSRAKNNLFILSKRKAKKESLEKKFGNYFNWKVKNLIF
ncbi:MAG: UvrD-helicase domain-containing protein [Leptospiraceae bacterium]|nr:UvrD-helicase domain-containing protein [Leptospiraceae bacterium]